MNESARVIAYPVKKKRPVKTIRRRYKCGCGIQLHSIKEGEDQLPEDVKCDQCGQWPKPWLPKQKKVNALAVIS